MYKIFFSIALCVLMLVSCNNHNHEEGEQEQEILHANAIVFNKEQQAKVDFAVDLPIYGEFGQIIKTVAKVQSAIGDETVIVAKTSGTVLFLGDNITLGKPVSIGQNLFSIANEDFADNNFSVKFLEAKNNFNRLKVDYDRATELAKTKIISEKELQQVKTDYENAKANYDNLKDNFSIGGQNVTSSINGFVKQINVGNGQFVEIGQALAVISRNKNLYLTANVQPKYLPYLSRIKTANIRTTDGKPYTLEELGGRLVSYGKSAEGDNFLIPITFQVENREGFVPGGFVDLFIKTADNGYVISVPNEAITEEMGNYFVYVQLCEEEFEKRQVQIKCTDGKSTEITSGLLRDERIVTRGAIFVKLVAASGNVDAHSGHTH